MIFCRNSHQPEFFSKLDLTSAFWQLNLDDESSKLTCFNTPFGRFRWRRFPFGLSVSSEIFQHRLNAALEGLPGVICVADDIVVYGKGGDDNAALIDHDAKLTRLLERCSALNIKLNRSKSVFRTTDIPFLGHRITKHGLGPDPQKVEAVLNMPVPEDVQDIQRLVGFVNYLSRYLPSLSDVLEPLRQLTRPEVPWHWTHAQQEALDQVKRLVTAAPVLAYYNPECELSIQCDASGKGLGAALHSKNWPKLGQLKLAFRRANISTTSWPDQVLPALGRAWQTCTGPMRAAACSWPNKVASNGPVKIRQILAQRCAALSSPKKLT